MSKLQVNNIENLAGDSLKVGRVNNSTTDLTNGGADDLTEVTFTIPSGASHITVVVDQASTNGTSPLLIQIGDSGGFHTSGYTGRVNNGNVTSSATLSSGFRLFVSNGVSTSTFTGKCDLYLMDTSTFVYAATSLFIFPTAAAQETMGGSVDLDTEITQLKITTVNGTDTFDNGTACVLYEI